MTKTKENKKQKIMIGIAIMCSIFILIACYNEVRATIDSSTREYVCGTVAILEFGTGEQHNAELCWECANVESPSIDFCDYEKIIINQVIVDDSITYTCTECGRTYTVPNLITKDEMYS